MDDRSRFILFSYKKHYEKIPPPFRLSRKGDWGKPLFGLQRAVSPNYAIFLLGGFQPTIACWPSGVTGLIHLPRNRCTCIIAYRMGSSI